MLVWGIDGCGAAGVVGVDGGCTLRRCAKMSVSIFDRIQISIMHPSKHCTLTSSKFLITDPDGAVGVLG